jgi:hypothetical protein
MAKFDPSTPDSTTFGGGDAQTVLYVRTVATPDKPSIIALDAPADSTGVITTYYLWVDTDGKLRVGTAIPANQNGEGTVVGTQS